MRKYSSLLMLVFIALFLYNCKIEARPKGEEIAVDWNLIENNYQDQTKFLAEFIFENNSSSTLKNKWAFYFNFSNSIYTDSNSLVTFEHVNGDLWKMTPKGQFKLESGKKIQLPFIGNSWAIKYTDAPAGGFFVFDDAPDKPENIKEDIHILPINEEQTRRSTEDVMPIETPQILYAKYQSYGLTKLKPDELIPVIPSPVKFEKLSGTFLLDKNVIIYYDRSFNNEADFLAGIIQKHLGERPKVAEDRGNISTGIFLQQAQISVKGVAEEAYSLEVKNNKIVIKASTSTGIFNGLQTLKALLPVESYKSAKEKIEIACVTVTDAPLFAYRGVHLDAARNFQSKQSIFKLLDLMALYKLNKFHFHFCDDEGWRIEIKSLPELTTVGSYRQFNPKDPDALLSSFGSGPNKEGHSGSGHYSRNDFIEILKYATARHIEVIPELDMPGHARAAIRSMHARYLRLKNEGKNAEAEKFLLNDLEDQSKYQSIQGWNDNVTCVCRESLYAFVDEVTRDLKTMYGEAGAPFTTIHSGGDEVPQGVWEKSPICQKFLAQHPEYKNVRELQTYFIKRFKEVMDRHDLRTAGWEEIALRKTGDETEPMKELAGKGYFPYVWNNVWGGGREDVAYKLANAGFPVVLCNATNFYFDMAYSKNTEEPGTCWAAFTNTRTAFEFTPFDIRNCAYNDLMGHKIDAYKLFEKKQTLNEQGKQNITGIEGLLWAENTRSSAMQEYMYFPKILALAERAWAQTPGWASISNEKERLVTLNKDWNKFANTVGQKELPKLDAYNVKYRIAPPGAIIENGELKASVEFPGLQIRYTTDGSEPTESSGLLYQQPVKVSGTVKLKAFAPDGQKSRTAVVDIR